MSERLAAFIAEREGLAREAVRVAGLRRLAGGASRLLWSVDVELESGEGARRLALVLRQDPPGRIAAGGMALEFALLQAAAEQGVPVPRVQWCEPGAERLGAPFFSMERLTGEAIPRRLLRDDRFAPLRARLPERLGEILARIHRIDFEAPSLAGRLQRPPADKGAALTEIERLAGGYRGLAVEPHPVLDLAERWLRRHAPVSERLALVHGDYRMGNLLCDERDVVGVLDWELAHVGDPVEDLAWVCVRAWRFGRDDLAAGGGLRGRGRRPGGCRAPALLGGGRELQARAGLHHPGPRLSRRCAPERGAGLPRSPHGRGRARAARADRMTCPEGPV
jgi:aminoglycoside phosphotransferase (APT) family kinase protein